MKRHLWKGFDVLSKGTFENGGQNLYVSRNGVLQRIWQFDINGDGYVDLLIANSHDYNEHPSLSIFHDPAGQARLQQVLTQGAQAGAVGDLNGDGRDELVVAATHDGHHWDLPSYVYFGGQDGITENRKVELAAPACSCCGIGDFDGDGRKELCYLIADGIDASSPTGLHNHRLRLYRQGPGGFSIASYRDFPTEVSYFTVADLDGDGCDDLYCRTADGRWLVLWSGEEGFSATPIGEATDDAARFDLLPFGGGNVRYGEFARPKVLQWKGETVLFYAARDKVQLLRPRGRQQPEIAASLPVANVISAGTGFLGGRQALVLLQLDGLERQSALVYDETLRLLQALPVQSPRDVLLWDFSGTGSDDLVVLQGRSEHAFTFESLLYCSDSSGRLCPEPRRFVTHNAVEVFAADFDGRGKQALVFVNQQQSSAYGHVPVYAYLGGPDGFRPDRRLEFPGHSAGTMLPIDFNDDGFPDLLVLQNGEDQPFFDPPGDLYWGSKEGFSLQRKTTVPATLAWGGHCADLNRDGYLDILAACGNRVRILYGSEEGYLPENAVDLEVLERPEDGPAIGALWPAIGDLNGNGYLDLVIPLSWQPYSRIFWGGEEGYSKERSTLLPIENALTVRIADLNKDGFPDLIFGSRASYHTNVYHQGTVTIFWGSKEGYSGYNCCVLPSYQTNCITIADFNGDGYLDLFASSYFNKRERDICSYLYWNDRGRFSVTNRQRFFAHSSSAAWACDFNEDGYVDLCVTNHRAYGNHATESAIWWNGPQGFREEDRTWLPTLGPHDMVPNDQGNVMTRGPEEFYITPEACCEAFAKVSWEGTIPQKCWVNCQLRTGESRQALLAAPFLGPDGTANSRFSRGETIPAALRRGPWVQVKLYLGAVNSGQTPRITELSLEE